MSEENIALDVESARTEYDAAVAAHEAPTAALVDLESRLTAELPVSREERRAVNVAYQESEAAVNAARIALVEAERRAAAERGEPVDVGPDQTVGG